MSGRKTKENYLEKTYKECTPSFTLELSPVSSKTTIRKDSSLERLRDSTNSTSVANCIRGLNQKASFLTKENANLKNYNAELLKEIKTITEQYRTSEETREIICSYKEKCIILEQSNEIFQKKLQKSEEINGNYEALRAELILMNKELSKEIEKNQELNLLTNRLQDEKVYLQNEIENLNGKILNRGEQGKKKSGYYEEFKLKESENNNRLLEDLLEQQQSELEEKRKQIENLKNMILDFENVVWDMKKQKKKADSFIQEISQINEELVRALKKKNCKHRSATPDLPSTGFVSKSHSGTFMSNFLKNRQEIR